MSGAQRHRVKIWSDLTGDRERQAEPKRPARLRKAAGNSVVYVYDFGSVEVKPDRFMRQRDALILNSDLWGLAWLRPINLVELAKTGDNEKKMLVGEYTLTARNEAGSGLVADLL